MKYEMPFTGVLGNITIGTGSFLIRNIMEIIPYDKFHN
jgi:hypothetical protein